MSDAPIGGRPAAVILTGGAAFGAWQAGVLAALDRAGMVFKAAAGASAGALNAASWCLTDLGVARSRWTSIRRRDLFRLSPGIRPPRLFSIEPLLAILGDFADDERAKKVARCHLFVITADISDGTLFQARYSPGGTDGWDGPLREHLAGSCAIPVIYPPVRVPKPGGGERLLLDGGMREATDLEPLLALGCRDFVLIDIVDPGELRRPKFGPMTYFATLAEQLVQGHIQNTLAVLKAKSEAMAAKGEALRAWVVRPSRHVKLDALGFSPQGCGEAYDLGEVDGAAFLKDPSRSRAF